MASSIDLKPLRSGTKDWSDIKLIWSNYQVEHNDWYTLEKLRNFLSSIVHDLCLNPKNMLAKDYAFLFNAMRPEVPWQTLGQYRFEDRISILCSMGWLAERGSKEKSRNNRRVEAEWIFQLKRMFEHMATPYRNKDAIAILNSRLSPHYKLRICGEFASSAMWLNPKNAEKIKLLLPKKAANAFQYFTWDEEDVESNKALIRVFFPALYPLLDLTMVEDEWTHRYPVAQRLASLNDFCSRRNKQIPLEPPSTFYEEL